MKIIVLDGDTLNHGDIDWDVLGKYGELTVYDRTDDELISERIQECDIVFTNKTPIQKEHMIGAKNLKFIGVLATGYNIVDVAAARELGIDVSNIPAYGTDAVAQHVFALILSICNSVSEHSRAVFDGQWTRCIDFCFWNQPLIELKEKTLGLIGFGNIGKQTARIANAFNMNVLVYTRTPNYTLETENLKFVSLDDLYKLADIISMHLPLFESTSGMINSETIAKMKDNVIFINTSRGGLVVEEDLKEALISGKIKAAAIDVISVEPMDEDNILLKAPNLLITPHIAWAPLEARKRLLGIASDNLQSFIDGKTINLVN
ncbi:MAG: D-2-hydroxyacid dehydrogenase [Acidaminobacteraceae bacterium]